MSAQVKHITPPHVHPDTGYDESRFREGVREILDLSHLSRNEQIFEELRRLKDVERCYKITEEEEVRLGRIAAAAFRATESQS